MSRLLVFYLACCSINLFAQGDAAHRRSQSHIPRGASKTHRSPVHASASDAYDLELTQPLTSPSSHLQPTGYGTQQGSAVSTSMSTATLQWRAAHATASAADVSGSRASASNQLLSESGETDLGQKTDACMLSINGDGEEEEKPELSCMQRICGWLRGCGAAVRQNPRSTLVTGTITVGCVLATIGIIKVYQTAVSAADDCRSAAHDGKEAGGLCLQTGQVVYQQCSLAASKFQEILARANLLERHYGPFLTQLWERFANSSASSEFTPEYLKQVGDAVMGLNQGMQQLGAGLRQTGYLMQELDARLINCSRSNF